MYFTKGRTVSLPIQLAEHFEVLVHSRDQSRQSLTALKSPKRGALDVTFQKAGTGNSSEVKNCGSRIEGKHSFF